MTFVIIKKNKTFDSSPYLLLEKKKKQTNLLRFPHTPKTCPDYFHTGATQLATYGFIYHA
jgi:hypothetical protein